MVEESVKSEGGGGVALTVACIAAFGENRCTCPTLSLETLPMPDIRSPTLQDVALAAGVTDDDCFQVHQWAKAVFGGGGGAGQVCDRVAELPPQSCRPEHGDWQNQVLVFIYQIS